MSCQDVNLCVIFYWQRLRAPAISQDSLPTWWWEPWQQPSCQPQPHTKAYISWPTSTQITFTGRTETPPSTAAFIMKIQVVRKFAVYSWCAALKLVTNALLDQYLWSFDLWGSTAHMVSLHISSSWDLQNHLLQKLLQPRSSNKSR